jgi:hypothetical protein
VIRVIEETPVHRRTQEHVEDRLRDESPSPRANRRQGQEYTRVVHFRDDSPSPPPLHRGTAPLRMTHDTRAPGFTPLPPIIKMSPPRDSNEDRGFDVEDRAPLRKSSRSYKKKSSHRRTDSKLDYDPEYIEIPSSPRRFHETEAERARRKAERNAADALNAAAQNADVAYQERRRRVEVEDLTRNLERAYIDERDIRRDAVREAQEAKARADELARQLEKEKREKRYLERKAEILAREKKVAEEQEQLARAQTVLRPVDLHQDLRPSINRDPGSDAIRRAQEDARRREQHNRDDELLYGHQRDQRRGHGHGRRGSKIIYEDDAGRRGYRRE